jgi:hypothetical protein
VVTGSAYTLDFRLWFLFVMLGVSMSLGALVRPPMVAKKPRPRYEADLE